MLTYLLQTANYISVKIFSVNRLETPKSIACLGFHFLKVSEILAGCKGLLMPDSVSNVLTLTTFLMAIAKWKIWQFLMRFE